MLSSRPMTPTLRAVTPAIYRDLLSSAFDVPLVSESRATCSACPMCSHDPGEERGVFPRFSPGLRCCTYDPPLPNFLVGAILSDADPSMEEGRRRLRARIATRIGVTPHWVKASPSVRARREAIVVDGFGRAEELLCPFYDDGTCTIWRHRDAVCATFFCRHERGPRARRFWAALRDYLLRVELRLAQWAAQAVEPTSDEPGPIEEPTTDEPMSSHREARLFGAHAGRVEAFYVACADAVRALDHDGFEAAVDATPRANALLAEMMVRHRELVEPMPAATHLVLASSLRRERVADGVLVSADSPWDPTLLDDHVERRLATLSPDEPFEVAAARLHAGGLELTPALVEDLRTFEILVPPATPRR